MHFLIWETLSFNLMYVAACYPVGTTISKTSSLFTALLQHYDSDELYCVTKEQPHIAYQSLYLFIFLSLQWKFLSQISLLLLEPVFSNFVYIFRMAKCTV